MAITRKSRTARLSDVVARENSIKRRAVRKSRKASVVLQKKKI